MRPFFKLIFALNLISTELLAHHPWDLLIDHREVYKRFLTKARMIRNPLDSIATLSSHPMPLNWMFNAAPQVNYLTFYGLRNAGLIFNFVPLGNLNRLDIIGIEKNFMLKSHFISRKIVPSFYEPVPELALESACHEYLIDARPYVASRHQADAVDIVISCVLNCNPIYSPIHISFRKCENIVFKVNGLEHDEIPKTFSLSNLKDLENTTEPEGPDERQDWSFWLK